MFGEKAPSPAVAVRDQITKANPVIREALDGKALSIEGAVNYSVPRSQAARLSERFLSEHPMLKAKALMRAEKLLETHKRHFSLPDAVLAVPGGNTASGMSERLRTIDSFFDPNLGSLIVPAEIDPATSRFSDFYTHDRYYKAGGKIELRGDNYFVAHNSKVNDEVRLDVMKDDMASGLIALTDIKRSEITNPKDYLLYLGTIDYLKLHSLALLNLVSYSERRGTLSGSDRKRQEYFQIRNKAVGLAVSMTRFYYQTLLGLDYDGGLDFEKTLKDYEEVVDYSKKKDPKVLRDPDSHRAKYPEVNHPLVIALGAQESVLRNPDVETVVGIPSGGTETAIVMQMLYEQLEEKKTDLAIVPVSSHKIVLSEKLSEMIKSLNINATRGKNVILVDDNSTSGKTLEFIARALMKNHPASLKVHVAQYDARKLKQPPPADYADEKQYFDPYFSPTSMGIIMTDPDRRYNAKYETEIKKRLRKE